jgi:hypothetical protein
VARHPPQGNGRRRRRYEEGGRDGGKGNLGRTAKGRGGAGAGADRVPGGPLSPHIGRLAAVEGPWSPLPCAGVGEPRYSLPPERGSRRTSEGERRENVGERRGRVRWERGAGCATVPGGSLPSTGCNVQEEGHMGTSPPRCAHMELFADQLLRPWTLRLSAVRLSPVPGTGTQHKKYAWVAQRKHFRMDRMRQPGA